MKHFTLLSKLLSFPLVLILSMHSYAYSPNEFIPASAHLKEVNTQWMKYPSLHSNKSIAFDSDNDRIQYHLQEVIKNLRSSPPKGISRSALLKRTDLIESLNRYQARKVFPINLYHSERTPYFIDHRGIHCAVGYLIKVSGYEDLALKIKEAENYAYIGEIKTAGVSEWAVEHGFTLDELAWIQPSYPSSIPYRAVSGSPNGPVYKMENSTLYSSDEKIIIGSFDSINGSPCSNVGFYDDYQFSCIKNGLEGDVRGSRPDNSAFNEPSKLSFYGKVQANGQFYSVAQFYPDSNYWDYINVPGREGNLATAFFQGVYTMPSMICLDVDSIPGLQELYIKQGQNAWKRVARFNGQVLGLNDFGLSGSDMYLIGNFDSIEIYDTTGSTIQSTLAVNNIAFYDWYNQSWTNPGNPGIDTIKTSFGNFFAGSCNSGTSNDVCLSQYVNGVFAPLLIAGQDLFGASPSINTLAAHNNQLLVGGSFGAGFYIQGQNLAIYNLLSHTIEGYGYFNNSVSSICKDYFNSQEVTFVGGAFTENTEHWTVSPLEYFAEINISPTTDTTIIDTVHVYDTITVIETTTIIDTINNDTLYVMDTLVLLDTTYIIDSIVFTDSLVIIVSDTVQLVDSVLITVSDTVFFTDTVFVIDTVFLGSSFEPLKDVDLGIYPNPVSNRLQISFHENSENLVEHLFVYDIAGRQRKALEYSVPRNQNLVEIDVSHLPSGQYILLLDGKRMKMQSKPFVVQH